MLACPSCQQLVQKERLEELASQATSATAAGDITTALQLWREALEQLPRDSNQHRVISREITRLGMLLPKSRTATHVSKSGTSKQAGVATGIGAVGLLAWKLKALLAGLTKSTTLFSMLASLGVYWTVWGWSFALGIVLSIYVHEMGHVIQLRRYGFRTGVPMFIPGLGAVIRMQQSVVNPREDADIGLAGPIYGLGAAVVALLLWQVTSLPIFAAIAGVGAWINLFNLLPFGSLDGGRAIQALSRVEKIVCAACIGLSWFLAQDGILILLLIGCTAQIFVHENRTGGYPKAAVIYCMLVLILTAISLVQNRVDDTLEAVRDKENVTGKLN